LIPGKLSMAFDCCVILIVEPDVSLFTLQLQDATQAERGESVVVLDPTTALPRCGAFRFSAALVSAKHRDVAGELPIPATIYEPADGLPTVLMQLKGLLSEALAH
jgi:hypothetical protein